jgi:hypothetical protein
MLRLKRSKGQRVNHGSVNMPQVCLVSPENLHPSLEDGNIAAGGD